MPFYAPSTVNNSLSQFNTFSSPLNISPFSLSASTSHFDPVPTSFNTFSTHLNASLSPFHASPISTSSLVTFYRFCIVFRRVLASPAPVNASSPFPIAAFPSSSFNTFLSPLNASLPLLTHLLHFNASSLPFNISPSPFIAFYCIFITL